jgi:translin
MNPLDLDDLEHTIRGQLDSKFAARELAIVNCRNVIRASANAIRALHRGERVRADELMAEAKALIDEIEEPLRHHQDIYHAGFFYDAVKEYAEARITAALLAREPVPYPTEIGIETVPFLKGLGEAVGELRRRLLDELRTGKLEDAEATFAAMEAIHDVLTALDYPDGMTAGLRRTTDVARALIERSRADLTATIVQERLRRQLSGE